MNGNLNGKMQDILSDEELKALLEEIPSVQRKEENDSKSEEGEIVESKKNNDFISDDKNDYKNGYKNKFWTGDRFLTTYFLSIISEFATSITPKINSRFTVKLLKVQKEEVFSSTDLLTIKGKIEFLNIPKAEYTFFILFPKKMFPIIIDSVLSSPSLGGYPEENLELFIYSAVDWDIVKFFWSFLINSFVNVTSREFSKVRASIEDYESDSSEVTAFSLRKTLLKFDLLVKIGIWKFETFFFIDYDFIDLCELIHKGILKERSHNWRNIVKERVLSSHVDVDARVIFSNFSIKRLLSLKKGDILFFSPENVWLVANGEPLIKGKLGTTENNLLAISLSEEDKKEDKVNVMEVGTNGSA